MSTISKNSLLYYLFATTTFHYRCTINSTLFAFGLLKSFMFFIVPGLLLSMLVILVGKELLVDANSVVSCIILIGAVVIWWSMWYSIVHFVFWVLEKGKTDNLKLQFYSSFVHDIVNFVNKFIPNKTIQITK